MISNVYTVRDVLPDPNLPSNFVKPSIFLAGPIERRKEGVAPKLPRWRDEAKKHLEKQKERWRVFDPEWETKPVGWSYEKQVSWEVTALQAAGIILFWIPRKLPELPAFTTNIELGEWLHSGKIVVGAPKDAPHTKYAETRCRWEGVPWRNDLEELCLAAYGRWTGENNV